MPWSTKIDAIKLKRLNDELTAKLLHTREALATSERRRLGMEIALSARLTRIGELSGRIDALREQNKRLDAEADRLADMVRFAARIAQQCVPDCVDGNAGLQG